MKNFTTVYTPLQRLGCAHWQLAGIAILCAALAGCGGAFTDPGDPYAVLPSQPAVQPSDFYGDWLYRVDNLPNWPQISALKITESSVHEYNYDVTGTRWTVDFQAKRWFPHANPYTEFAASSSYPQGFVITAMQPNGSGSVERVMQELYLHPDKQSLLRYLDGTYYIYNKGPARDTDDGVQKRITITGIPWSDYSGGPPAVVLRVHSFYEGAPTVSGYTYSQGTNDATVVLKKAEPGQDGPFWTGTGTYRLWLEIHATTYQGEELPGLRDEFQKRCVVISGEETVIPLTPEEWEGWPYEVPRS